MKNRLVSNLAYRDEYIINLAQEAAKKLKKIVENVDNRDYIYIISKD